MAIVTVDDVEAELPSLKISEATVPTSAQVASYIEDIEAEVRSYVEEKNWAWPTDASENAYQFLRQTVLEGVKYKTIQAKYAMQMELPESARFSRNNYNDRLRRLQNNVMPAAFFTGSQVPHYSGPRITSREDAPTFGQSFDEWTQAVQRRRLGTSPVWWPT